MAKRVSRLGVMLGAVLLLGGGALIVTSLQEAQPTALVRVNLGDGDECKVGEDCTCGNVTCKLGADAVYPNLGPAESF